VSGPPPDSIRTLFERFDRSVFDAPGGKARIRLVLPGEGQWDLVIDGRRRRLVRGLDRYEPDALVTADSATWQQITRDVTGGMEAFSSGRLVIRRNLHLGVGFLAATSGMTEPGRLRFHTARTEEGRISVLEAGEGEPVLLLHGLGATKASFMPTVAALAPAGYRTIALDLPGFGDSSKPIGAPYDAQFFARSTVALMDALELDRAYVVGNSMGGRVALEMGMSHHDRVERIALLSPSLAWLRRPGWVSYLRFLRPELGLIQPTPRPVVERVVRGLIPGARDDWTAVGVDEFLRAYLTPRGRAAFYAAARNIALEAPHGDDGFWTRLRALQSDTLFVWGRNDSLVPISFMRHVEKALPGAEHVELDCGHVPQLERPRETHAAILRFFRAGSSARAA
jgi:pimeloyl-ACP methyl ester carboxylesterase